jgi:hypothetical protein
MKRIPGKNFDSLSLPVIVVGGAALYVGTLNAMIGGTAEYAIIVAQLGTLLALVRQLTDEDPPFDGLGIS